MYMHVLPTCNSDLVHQDLFQKKNSWKLSTQEVMILLMAEILHQLIGSFSHYLQGFIGAGFQPSTVGHDKYIQEHHPPLKVVVEYPLKVVVFRAL